jgi:hypothetical protein
MAVYCNSLEVQKIKRYFAFLLHFCCIFVAFLFQYLKNKTENPSSPYPLAGKNDNILK